MKIVDKESKTNLPRWFNGVSIILKNMRCGSLEIILPDNRNFIYQGIEKGPKGIIFVKNNDFFSRLVREGENGCLLYTSPSPRDRQKSRMPSSA